ASFDGLKTVVPLGGASLARLIEYSMNVGSWVSSIVNSYSGRRLATSQNNSSLLTGTARATVTTRSRFTPDATMLHAGYTSSLGRFHSLSRYSLEYCEIANTRSKPVLAEFRRPFSTRL